MLARCSALCIQASTMPRGRSRAAAAVGDVLGDSPRAAAGQVAGLGQPAGEVALTRTLVGEAALVGPCAGCAWRRPWSARAGASAARSPWLRRSLLIRQRTALAARLPDSCAGEASPPLHWAAPALPGSERQDDEEGPEGEAGGDQAQVERHTGLVVRPAAGRAIARAVDPCPPADDESKAGQPGFEPGISGFGDRNVSR